jgi:hypothetical protein
MKLPWFDINKLLMCPNCRKSEGLALVWSGGDNHRGRHEDDFVCGLCNCEFTAVYKIEGIDIIEEGEKKNG